ncbi:SHOCT domain-containing protein [Periweissella ghanensis]|uniref:SHOCT domain-containing protein n=1 Tax=Periweissella ghanensis TaxID=467997 RepID=A0ABM8ZDX2_9LACO|nr:SHOCT domain-containing protein [Periweissella ghanensis]MCM0601333.1 SHOCT domain-containing protein [Periweissella ghanensis]CAH0419377.1 hypothetical protein WGH24286_01827 [Periweissella ghanensis]
MNYNISVKMPWENSISFNGDIIKLHKKPCLRTKMLFGKENLDLTFSISDVVNVSYNKASLKNGYIKFTMANSNTKLTNENPYAFHFSSNNNEILDLYTELSKSDKLQKNKMTTQELRASSLDADPKGYINNFHKTATVKIDNYLMFNQTTDEILINKSILTTGKTEIIKADTIRSFEVIKDGEKSEKFGLGGATAGAILFGPVGLIGGFLLKKKKNVVSDLRVRINTTGTQSIHDIVLINSKTKANGLVASAANSNLEKIVNFIQSINFKNTEKASNTSVQSERASYDELSKLKELLDKGIITQEDFDAKKKQILGI